MGFHLFFLLNIRGRSPRKDIYPFNTPEDMHITNHSTQNLKRQMSYTKDILKGRQAT